MIPPVIYTLACVLIVFLSEKYRLLTNKRLIVAFILLNLVLFAISKQVTFNKLWYSYLIVFALMIFKLISNLFNYDEIETKSIEKGMILSQTTTFLFRRSKVRGLPKISDETLKSRITEEEAQAIRRWSNSKYGEEKIQVVCKIPFAIFITAGMLSYFVIGCVYY